MHTESQRARDESEAETESQQPEAQNAPYIPTSPPTPQPIPVPTPQPEPPPPTTPEPPPQPEPELDLPTPPAPPQPAEPDQEQPPAPDPQQPVETEPAPIEEAQPPVEPIALRHPVAGSPVTQWFGKNPNMYKKWGLAGHEGIDFGCRKGTTILAAAAGKVIRCGPSPNDGPLGTYVLLEHQWGDMKGYSVYAHLSEVAEKIATGKKVAAGTILGESGDTGNVTGPHLHFALLLANQPLEGYVGPRNLGDVWWHDPKPYIAEFQVAGFPATDGEIDHDHVCGGPPIDFL